uniref:Uncharacterized protein n=1 Tax=Cacopsylla melanoneura TaxID=428564 RepID=A0A8D9B783_9HEMI
MLETTDRIESNNTIRSNSIHIFLITVTANVFFQHNTNFFNILPENRLCVHHPPLSSSSFVLLSILSLILSVLYLFIFSSFVLLSSILFNFYLCSFFSFLFYLFFFSSSFVLLFFLQGRFETRKFMSKLKSVLFKPK